MTTPVYTSATLHPLPEDFRVRRFTWEDLPGFVALTNRYAEAVGDPDRVDEENLRSDFESPDFKIEENVWTATDANGNIVARVENAWGTGARNWSNVWVDPSLKRRDLEAHLVEMTEKAMRAQVAVQFPDGRAVSAERYVTPIENDTRDLYVEMGYRYIRSFYHMGVDLITLGEIPAPELPAGLEIRPVEAAHLPQIYEAVIESFADHWGWSGRPYEDWLYYAVNSPGSDTKLWRIAWAGDQVASVTINRPFGDAIPDKGWISTVGTRRPWRRLGLGTILLRESFRALRDAGFKQASLGVDAASLTGAVALYERAGMYVEVRYDGYAKMLRGDWLPIYPQE